MQKAYVGVIIMVILSLGMVGCSHLEMPPGGGPRNITVYQNFTIYNNSNITNFYNVTNINITNIYNGSPPSGPDGAIQFMDDGNFSGDGNFTYNKITHEFNITGAYSYINGSRICTENNGLCANASNISQYSTEFIIGQNFTGVEGTTNRKYTVTFVPDIVVLERQVLYLNEDYRMSGNDLEILLTLFNDNRIQLYHSTAGNKFSKNQYYGTDCTGNNGEINRILETTSQPVVVVVEKQVLYKNEDYTTLGNNVTFLINIFDNNRIEVYEQN